jgi:hypothetical protein
MLPITQLLPFTFHSLHDFLLEVSPGEAMTDGQTDDEPTMDGDADKNP